MASLMEIFGEKYSNLDEARLKVVMHLLRIPEENNDFITTAYQDDRIRNPEKSDSISEYLERAEGIVVQPDKSPQKRFIELTQYFTRHVIVNVLDDAEKNKYQDTINNAVEDVIERTLSDHGHILDLHGLGLKELPTRLSDLRQLTILNLSDNSIRKIDALRSLRHLLKLDLAYNNIQEITVLADKYELSEIDLSHNLITDVHPLVNLKSLRKISLVENRIEKNLDNLSGLPKLQELDLRHNIINEDHLLSILSLAPNLKKIYLMGTGVSAPKSIVVPGDVDGLRRFYGITANPTKQPQEIINDPSEREQKTATDEVDEDLEKKEPFLPEIKDQSDISSESVEDPFPNKAKNETIRDLQSTISTASVTYSTMRSFSLFSKPEKNLFDTDKLAEIFRDLIINSERSEEQFFGLFGRWGRGKTFFWNLLKEKINKENFGYYAIEFHAWKYQDTPAIWAYLYDTIAERYYNKPQKWHALGKWMSYVYRIFRLNYVREKLFQSIFSLITKIGFAVLIYFLVPLFMPAAVGMAYDKILGFCLAAPITLYAVFEFVNKKFKTDAQQILQKLTKKINFESHLGIQHEIQKELAALLKSWIPKRELGNKRVLLFVDDIDRCSEIKIIQIVDYIRVLLHHEEIEKRMTVLAAIDERILVHAIKNKYNSFITSEIRKGDNLDGGQNISRDERIKQQLCREYIDKLFIASLKLGPLTDFERTEIVDAFTLNITKIKTVESHGERKEQGFDLDNDLTNDEQAYSKNEVSGERYKNEVSNESPEDSMKPEGKVDVGDLLANEQKIPVTPLFLLKDTSEEKYVLDAEEQEFINQLLTKYATDATPRSIRVYILRYLLGKRLIEKPLQLSNQSYKQWHTTLEGKKYFALMLLNYTFDDNNNTETLENDYKEFLSHFSTRNEEDNLQSFDLSTDYKHKIYDQQFSIRSVLGSIIYQVLSMVVAY